MSFVARVVAVLLLPAVVSAAPGYGTRNVDITSVDFEIPGFPDTVTTVALDFAIRRKEDGALVFATNVDDGGGLFKAAASTICRQKTDTVFNDHFKSTPVGTCTANLDSLAFGDAGDFFAGETTLLDESPALYIAFRKPAQTLAARTAAMYEDIPKCKSLPVYLPNTKVNPIMVDFLVLPLAENPYQDPAVNPAAEALTPTEKDIVCAAPDNSGLTLSDVTTVCVDEGVTTVCESGDCGAQTLFVNQMGFSCPDAEFWGHCKDGGNTATGWLNMAARDETAGTKTLDDACCYCGGGTKFTTASTKHDLAHLSAKYNVTDLEITQPDAYLVDWIYRDTNGGFRFFTPEYASKQYRICKDPAEPTNYSSAFCQPNPAFNTSDVYRNGLYGHHSNHVYFALMPEGTGDNRIRRSDQTQPEYMACNVIPVTAADNTVVNVIVQKGTLSADKKSIVVDENCTKSGRTALGQQMHDDACKDTDPTAKRFIAKVPLPIAFQYDGGGAVQMNAAKHMPCGKNMLHSAGSHVITADYADLNITLTELTNMCKADDLIPAGSTIPVRPSSVSILHPGDVVARTYTCAELTGSAPASGTSSLDNAGGTILDNDTIEEEEEEKSGDSTDNTDAIIVGSVLGGVAVMVLVAILVVLMRRPGGSGYSMVNKKSESHL